MNVKITIPTTLSDIKLSQYQKFIKTTKDSKDDNFIARQMVGIFCNVTDEVVGLIKANDFDNIVNDISKVLEQKPVFIDRFKLDGVKYGFIPNLEDITVDEKADLDNFFKGVENMDKAMGVMYRPIVSENKQGYLIEDYKANSKSLDVSLDIVFGANVFFSTLMKDLLNYIQNSIRTQAVHNQNLYPILAKNGGGITAFMNYLEEIFSDLEMLVNLDYMKR